MSRSQGHREAYLTPDRRLLSPFPRCQPCLRRWCLRPATRSATSPPPIRDIRNGYRSCTARFDSPREARWSRTPRPSRWQRSSLLSQLPRYASSDKMPSGRGCLRWAAVRPSVNAGPTVALTTIDFIGANATHQSPPHQFRDHPVHRATRWGIEPVGPDDATVLGVDESSVNRPQVVWVVARSSDFRFPRLLTRL